jgi:hypothetical protein
MKRLFFFGIFLGALAGVSAGCGSNATANAMISITSPTSPTTPTTAVPTPTAPADQPCELGYGPSISIGPMGGPLGHSITANRPGCSWTVTVTSGGSFNRLTNGSQPNTAASIQFAVPGNTLSGVTGADSRSEYWSFVDPFTSTTDRVAEQTMTAPGGVVMVKRLTQTAK